MDIHISLNKYNMAIFLCVIAILIYIVNHYRYRKFYNIHPNPETIRSGLNIINIVPETKKDKNDILFFMSFDYTKIPEYGRKSIDVMRKYCKIHGHTFKIFDDHKDVDISPYWFRVHDIYNLLKEGNYKTIIYLDLDTIINPNFFETDIKGLVQMIDDTTGKKWDMYLSIDPGVLNREMNTGIIVCRNTAWSKKFVKLWLDNYPSGFWKRDKGKWSCNNCVWAGDEYEQGMLNRLYERNVFDSKSHIIPVHYNLFGGKDINDNSLIYHFMGKSDRERLTLMNSLYP